jgi:REP element-mobilizing transposase RayT
MARKPRLEFEGAIYHVISRGNYRKALFEDGAAEAFERTLFEACAKCGWRLHAYVIMSNHYHLALETPAANLVEGMRWLQGTFGIRFNAFRRERGHVFQARYKSLIIEEGRPLLGLVNYIHLNPVRAGMVPLQELRQYAASSYPKFFDANPRPPLVRERFLSALEFPDTANGMTRYAEHLELAEEADAERYDELSRRYCRGWAVASEEYRQGLKKRYADLMEPAGWGGAEVAEMREEKWRRVLEILMRHARKSAEDARAEPKSARWKVKIARELRAGTTASNAWIAGQLSMGHPSRVSNLVHAKD